MKPRTFYETFFYNRNSVVAVNIFCKVFKNPSQSIVKLIFYDKINHWGWSAAVKANYQNHYFIGQQNLAFRGRRDDRRIGLENEQIFLQDVGDFRELLRFIVKAGDSVLENHLKNSAFNAPYISNTI
jgi:hypothetical protein